MNSHQRGRSTEDESGHIPSKSKKCPSSHKSASETHTTSSTSDDDLSSVSSISMDSVLKLDEISAAYLSNDGDESFSNSYCNSTSIVNKKKTRSKSPVPAFSESMVVVSSKKASAKKTKKTKDNKKIHHLDDVDVNNMRFDEGFSTKKSAFHESGKKLPVEDFDPESSANSLLEMFSATKICNLGLQSTHQMEQSKNPSLQENQDIESKLNDSKKNQDTKSRQSRKSTKVRRSRSPKPNHKIIEEPKEFEHVIVSHALVVDGKKAFRKAAIPPPDVPITFRSSRMIAKPQDSRSTSRGDDLSGLDDSSDAEGHEDDEHVPLLDGKLAEGMPKTLRSDRINIRKFDKQIVERKAHSEPIKITLPPRHHATLPVEPMVKRSFINTTLSTAFTRRGTDKGNSSDEGDDKLLLNQLEVDAAAKTLAKSSFSERVGLFNSDRPHRIPKESSKSITAIPRKGFAGLEDEINKDHIKVERRVGTVKPPRSDGNTFGLKSLHRQRSTDSLSHRPRRRISTDTSERSLGTDLGLKGSVHSALSRSLSSTGSIVRGSKASAERWSEKDRRRGSSRSLIIPGGDKKPRRRESHTSFDESDAVNKLKPTKSERSHAVDSCRIRRSRSTDKTKRSHSSDKTKRSRSSDKSILSRSSDKPRRSRSTDKPTRSRSTDKPSPADK